MRWGEWTARPAWANRQRAVASYLRRPGEAAFHAFNLDVLRVEVTSFPPAVFAGFGLPALLP